MFGSDYSLSDEDCRKIFRLLCSIYRDYIELEMLKLQALERRFEDEKNNDD